MTRSLLLSLIQDLSGPMSSMLLFPSMMLPLWLLLSSLLQLLLLSAADFLVVNVVVIEIETIETGMIQMGKGQERVEWA